MYYVLCIFQVKHPQSDGNGEQIVGFKNLIIKSCQDEFEKASVAERVSSVKQKEIDECTDLVSLTLKS